MRLIQISKRLLVKKCPDRTISFLPKVFGHKWPLFTEKVGNAYKFYKKQVVFQKHRETAKMKIFFQFY